MKVTVNWIVLFLISTGTTMCPVQLTQSLTNYINAKHHYQSLEIFAYIVNYRQWHTGISVVLPHFSLMLLGMALKYALDWTVVLKYIIHPMKLFGGTLKDQKKTNLHLLQKCSGIDHLVAEVRRGRDKSSMVMLKWIYFNAGEYVMILYIIFS